MSRQSWKARIVCGLRRLSRLKADACKGNAVKAALIAFACLRPDRRVVIKATATP